VKAPRLIAVVVVAVAIAGCGAAPRQAPLPDARTLNSATGTIATTCGESYQVHEFDAADKRELRRLDSTAITAAGRLAVVFHRNAAWVFQGVTVAEIAADGESMLDACRLHRAANVLASAIRKR
jgi:hypothetical protein